MIPNDPDSTQARMAPALAALGELAEELRGNPEALFLLIISEIIPSFSDTICILVLIRQHNVILLLNIVNNFKAIMLCKF